MKMRTGTSQSSDVTAPPKTRHPAYRTDYVPNARGDSVKFVARDEWGIGVSYAF